MKQIAFAIALSAFGLAASSPARADYTLIQFASGHCEVWHDSSDNPAGAGWRKLVYGPAELVRRHGYARLGPRA